jgi:hypothetical protein
LDWQDIIDLSKIAKPMTELLKKEVKFYWDDQCEEAFHTLRKLLTTAPVLAQPDSTKPFDVYCDASGTGLGCVLMQNNRVIACASRLWAKLLVIAGIMNKIIQPMILS